MTTLIALCNDPVEYSQANSRVRTTNQKTPACEPPAVATVRGTRPKSLTIAESRRAFLFGGKRGWGDRRQIGVAIARLGGALENRVGERRNVRVDAPQVANNAQKITVVDARGDRLGSGRADLQRPDVQSRHLSLLAAQLPLARQ